MWKSVDHTCLRSPYSRWFKFPKSVEEYGWQNHKVRIDEKCANWVDSGPISVEGNFWNFCIVNYLVWRFEIFCHSLRDIWPHFELIWIRPIWTHLESMQTQFRPIMIYFFTFFRRDPINVFDVSEEICHFRTRGHFEDFSWSKKSNVRRDAIWKIFNEVWLKKRFQKNIGLIKR